MDFWVVAAAAGAGYLTKFWQNIARDRDGGSHLHLSRSPSHGNLDLSSLIDRIHGKNSNEELSGSGIGCGNLLEGMSKQINDDGGVDDVDLLSSSEYRNHENIENEGDVGHMFEYKNSELGASLGSRSKNVLKSRHLCLQYAKPHGCFRENVELEEYFRSPLVSPCTTSLRPLLVTDGFRMISRASGGFGDEVRKNVDQKGSSGVVGVPALPLIGGVADLLKEKVGKDKSGGKKWNSRRASVLSDSQDGSSSGQVLFCLGISIGITCSIISNKLEVEKLKDSLKQSENLVQDLQEELEMKDSLTVKELVYDDDSQDTHENSCFDKRMNVFSRQMNSSVVAKCDDEESVAVKEVESRSKIEAELEAELERLELNMIGSSLQGTLSEHVELQFDHEDDDDTIPELVLGELKADVIQRRSSSEPTPDQGTSTTSTPLSVKYGVSPRELSLRLHELIQSRMQDRITELEDELTKTQKRVRDLESEKAISWRQVSNSESSSTLGSPLVYSPVTRPLVMNLADDAVDTYNEAYYELNQVNGSHNNEGRDNVSSANRGTLSDADDDLMLIKQIVEKARQGSPAVLRAQRAMVYLDD